MKSSASLRLGASVRFSKRGAAMLVALSIALLLGACGSGGGSGSTATASPDPQQAPANSGDVELVSVEYGRLVDVYGFLRTASGLNLTLFRSDVVIGPEIADERPTGSNLPDRDIEFDFLAVDPETLTPRLLLPREIGTQEFEDIFARLDDGNKRVTAGKFGQDFTVTPFTVVPRNAALRLTFSQSLGISDDFFVVRDSNGNVTGVRNTEAIQLLNIVGDPNDADDVGDFRVLPTRIIPRGNTVVLDPVFLGTEGVQYGTRNNASGMPNSEDQLGANMRLAIALEGPLAIPGIRSPAGSVFVGKNNDVFDSVIRDFRSGNIADNSPDLARGFIRDAEPPRVVGAIPFLLESVSDQDDRTQVITVFKNGRNHEVDRGDIVRVVAQTGEVVITEVSEEPVDDAGRPSVQVVRVPVRRVMGLSELNSALRPDFPASAPRAELERWLRQNAPRAVLVAEFTAQRLDPATNVRYGDDPANFLTFSPEPLPQVAGFDPFPGEPSLPNVNVSPFAGAIVRFTKPVDMESVKAFDSFFFATRDTLDVDAQDAFKVEFGLSDEQFTFDKYVTPHLVDARVFDESGSQTTLRLQPVKGFYLDEEMRRVPPPSFTQIPLGGSQVVAGTPATPHVTFTPDGYSAGAVATSKLPYFLHLVGGGAGIKDLSGNPIDFQSDIGGVDFLTIPFFLDGRKRADGTPFFEDNLVVSLVRRFANQDEDEQPSLYQLQNTNEYQFPMDDTFGAVVYTTEGKLVSRPATRVTKIVDNLNQVPPPPQTSILRWCPTNFSNEGTRASNSAAVAFPQGIQNPMNPYGARLQTVWREIDMSLSRVDPFDFNLDVEQMYWAPVTTASIFFDIFDEIALYLGHSEYRPEPCVGQFTALPVFTGSGLKNAFDLNFAHNQLHTGTGRDLGLFPEPHVAYEGVEFTINPQEAILEPNGINRYMPLPTFQQPYFVWRDETVDVQGGETEQGNDTTGTGSAYAPYILSPWLGGQCIPQTDNNGNIEVTTSFWDNRDNFQLGQNTTDLFTGGLLSSIALPLLADFQTSCDQPDLPAGFGFIANGFNGWQISLSVQSNPNPNFRVFSGGAPPTCIGPQDAAWNTARGQIGVNVAGDNSIYWTMADFLKRQTVATAGFVEILNPHRMPDRGPDDTDPRLGPYFSGGLPVNIRPDFEWHFEPPLSDLPNGTGIVPEFRAASRVVGSNWRDPQGQNRGGTAGSAPGVPNPCFALNPLCAGDAHLQKFDRRPFPGPGGQPRQFWSHYYNEHVTDYTATIADLMNPTFLGEFAGPAINDNLGPENIVYFNWRFVMTANTEASPPVSPVVESFAISYRFERTQ